MVADEVDSDTVRAATVPDSVEEIGVVEEVEAWSEPACKVDRNVKEVVAEDLNSVDSADDCVFLVDASEAVA